MSDSPADVQLTSTLLFCQSTCGSGTVTRAAGVRGPLADVRPVRGPAAPRPSSEPRPSHLQTAKARGLGTPQSVLGRANQIIE